MKIVFFTGHIAGEPRKATVTLLADSFVELGWDVRIVTLGYSWLTILKGNSRHAHAKTLTPNVWYSSRPLLKGYLQRTMLGPSRLPARWLNNLAKPFFRRYCDHLPSAVGAEIKDADVVVIESGPGLLLMKTLKRLMPRARFVYMVCDRLTTLRVNPVIMDAEKMHEAAFDLIVSPSSSIVDDFPNHPHRRFLPQGVETRLFDQPAQNPYPRLKNIVSVGDMLFHEEAVLTLARENPDWNVHLFGGRARCSQALPNIVTHGETPFSDIVPYIKYADIGLAPYRPAPGVEYISQSSLKLKQYTYARLPILAPAFAGGVYPNIVPYDPHQLDSMSPALTRAAALDHSAIVNSDIQSWPQIAQDFIGALEQVPERHA